MKGVRKYFCNKVLPLVYDDSLSYYEVLGKLTTKINEIVDYLNGQWTNTLKNFIYDKLNDLYVDVSYDATNKRLKLYLNSKIFADGEHVYTENAETIEIL